MSVKLGTYRHFKGAEYIVVGEAIMASPNEADPLPDTRYVLYKPKATSAEAADTYYLRTEEDFNAEVQPPVVPRFVKEV